MDTTFNEDISRDPNPTCQILCENVYCLYQQDGYCQFGRIMMNERGLCQNCRMLPLEESRDDLQIRKGIALSVNMENLK